jgi:predicted Fe-S protein YdhL (DUF1289 family)
MDEVIEWGSASAERKLEIIADAKKRADKRKTGPNQTR